VEALLNQEYLFMNLAELFYNPDIKFPFMLFPGKGIVINGDCTDHVFGMANLRDKVAQIVASDPPYGMTNESWDKILPLLWMRTQYFRVIDPEGSILITGSDSYIHHLTRVFSILPNGCNGKNQTDYEIKLRTLLQDVAGMNGISPELKVRLEEALEWIPTEHVYKYTLLWEKLSQYGNVLHSKNRPKTAHEYVQVFSRAAIKHKGTDSVEDNDDGTEVLDETDRPRMRYFPYGATHTGTVEHYDPGKSTYLGGKRHGGSQVETYINMPTSIIKAAKDTDRPVKTSNSTAKPTKLFEVLIGMFTTEGGLVIDPTVGSGTTAKAAMNMGRRFVVWEQDPVQFEQINQWLSIGGRSITAPTPPKLKFGTYLPKKDTTA